MPTHEERLAFWKFAYARASFVDARIFLEQILDSHLPLNHPVRKALSIAILTEYGRPFKQRPIVRLSRDVVPMQYHELHDSIIELRDKVVAHRDIDGPISDWGFVNQLEIAIADRQLEINTRSPVIPDEKAEEMLPLAVFLIAAMDATVNSFVTTHCAPLVNHPGVHVLRLDGHPTEWISRIR